MALIDWQKIEKMLPDTEISQVVEIFSVYADRYPVEIKVEVRQYPTGKYTGISNYSYWGPKQASPYKSLHMSDSIEAALIDSVSGLDSFYDESDGKKYTFWVKEDQTNPSAHIYVDGTGEAVDIAEVDARRKEWHKKHSKSP